MCTPPKKQKKRRYFHALPLVALPPLAIYLHINHNSFTSFKMYILLLFKAKTMNEEVLWVQVYAAANGCTHVQGQGENLSLSSTHVRIAPSLWLLMWIDLFVVLQAIASICLKYRKHISLCVCVCVCVHVGGGWGEGEGGVRYLTPTPTPTTPFRPLIREWFCLKCHCWPSPLPLYLVSHAIPCCQMQPK